MIKVKEAEIKVKGSKPTIMAELSTLFETLVEKDILTSEDIDLCVEVSRMPREKKAEAIVKNLFDGLIKHIVEEADDGEHIGN